MDKAFELYLLLMFGLFLLYWVVVGCRIDTILHILEDLQKKLQSLEGKKQWLIYYLLL